MTAFFGILGLVVIAGAVVYFYLHPIKPKPDKPYGNGNFGSGAFNGDHTYENKE
jgi:hypothetical protein